MDTHYCIRVVSKCNSTSRRLSSRHGLIEFSRICLRILQPTDEPFWLFCSTSCGVIIEEDFACLNCKRTKCKGYWQTFLGISEPKILSNHHHPNHNRQRNVFFDFYYFLHQYLDEERKSDQKDKQCQIHSNQININRPPMRDTIKCWNRFQFNYNINFWIFYFFCFSSLEYCLLQLVYNFYQ